MALDRHGIFKRFIFKKLPDGAVPVVICLHRWQIDLLAKEMAGQCSVVPVTDQCSCIPSIGRFCINILIEDMPELKLKYFQFEDTILVDTNILRSTGRNRIFDGSSIRTETDGEYYNRLKRMTIKIKHGEKHGKKTGKEGRTEGDRSDSRQKIHAGCQI